MFGLHCSKSLVYSVEREKLHRTVPPISSWYHKVFKTNGLRGGTQNRQFKKKQWEHWRKPSLSLQNESRLKIYCTFASWRFWRLGGALLWWDSLSTRWSLCFGHCIVISLGLISSRHFRKILFYRLNKPFLFFSRELTLYLGFFVPRRLRYGLFVSTELHPKIRFFWIDYIHLIKVNQSVLLS